MKRFALVLSGIVGCGGTATEGTETDSGSSTGSTSTVGTTEGTPTSGTSVDEPTGSSSDGTSTGGSSSSSSSSTSDPSTSDTTVGVSTEGTTVDETTTGTGGSTDTGESTTGTGESTETSGSSTGTSESTGTTADSSSSGEAVVCGDNDVGPGELCDDGNVDDSDECTSECLLAVCGDGFVQAGVDACDDANAVNNDLCSNHCVLTPTSVELAPGGNTQQFGNLNGGTAFNDPCPAGKALIGFQGFLAAYHGRIQGVCGTVGLAPAMEGFAVTVTDPVTLPQRGNQGNVQWMRMCPMDQVIVGFSGRAGGLIDQLTFTCAPLVVSEAVDGAWSIALGATSNLPAIGGNGGNAFPQTNCPAGQIGAMQRLRAGDGIDAFGIGCSTFALKF